MDATALRWVLAIIGVVVIVGVYLYTLYQGKLRRQAAIKTFTHEELETGGIEDESLRDELSHINTLLEQEVKEEDIEDININPAMDAAAPSTSQKKHEPVELPLALLEIDDQHRIAHVLRAEDGRLLTGHELESAMEHAQLDIRQDGFACSVDTHADYLLAGLSQSGSLADINDAEFVTPGLVCFFDSAQVENALPCYEAMLKKIDDLVRILDLKVYSEDMILLTLQHVTETRNRLV